MKIGIAQINPTVGDLKGNQRRIKEAYNLLVSEGADLILTPELALCGYPPRDLLFKSHFIEDMSEALDEITTFVGTVPLIVGTVQRDGMYYFNAAAWCENGSITAFGRKTLLPNYDVFDEVRYFKPAETPLIHSWKGKRIALTICEDIWIPSDVTKEHSYKSDPIADIAEIGLDLILNLSASPWHAGKSEQREQLVLSVAERCNCPIVYCNAVGGNDELVFDGGSMIADPERGILAGLSAFKEDLSVIEIGESWKPVVSEHYNPVGIAAIHDALVLGLRDYVKKSGFKSILLGLSGGIDSAVVCALAVEALGAENVTGIALPSAISSEHSRKDASDLAKNLGISFHEISIKETVSAAESALQPLFKNLDRDVTEENIQARSRGLLLMALSNKYGSLLLTTGNKSEIAVGYCTLYGDMCGGLSVISDLPKMKVYALARYINEPKEIIPLSTIVKAPSAELSPDQIDSDSLPDYPILDGILQLYVEEGLSRAKITAKGYDSAIVDRITRLVDLNEYKRKQAAPGLKITSIAFGVGRRIPIVQKYIN
jgi:NAD+ synthase (glutamine-hydrolysing)